jgi:hypothetical protein
VSSFGRNDGSFDGEKKTDNSNCKSKDEMRGSSLRTGREADFSAAPLTMEL